MRAGADSDSDISEAIKDQQKELMETVRTKNKQISDLLHDIEVKFVVGGVCRIMVR